MSQDLAKTYLTGPQTSRRYDVNDRTIVRWEADTTLNFRSRCWFAAGSSSRLTNLKRGSDPAQRPPTTRRRLDLTMTLKKMRPLTSKGRDLGANVF